MGLRLLDFGGHFSLTETDTQRLVYELQTLQYRAPEVLQGGIGAGDGGGVLLEYLRGHL